MSFAGILKSESVKCVMKDKVTVSDGEGGTKNVWQDGAPFDATIVLDNSTEARIGQAQGLKSVYTVITNKSVNLQYHDVFYRKTDNKVFRVTSDGDDMASPEGSALYMRQVSAEEWEIPK